MSRIEGMSSGKKPTFGWLNMAGAGIGGIIGGLLGFLLGGPIGLAIGLAVGAGAGYVGTKVLVQKFT